MKGFPLVNANKISLHFFSVIYFYRNGGATLIAASAVHLK